MIVPSILLTTRCARRWSYGLRDGGRDRSDVDSAETQMMSGRQKTGRWGLGLAGLKLENVSAFFSDLITGIDGKRRQEFGVDA